MARTTQYLCLHVWLGESGLQCVFVLRPGFIGEMDRVELEDFEIHAIAEGERDLLCLGRKLPPFARTTFYEHDARSRSRWWFEENRIMMCT